MPNFSFDRYFNTVSDLLVYDGLFNQLETAASAIVECKSNGGRIYMAGNGASSSIVSHAALDFTKQAKVQSIPLTDDALITAYANDYGFNNWIACALEDLINQHDIFLCVSVSGESLNVVNGLKKAKALGNLTITFSGKSKTNTVSSLGDINFHVASDAYNIVEGLHMIWLTAIIDRIIGDSIYSVADF